MLTWFSKLVVYKCLIKEKNRNYKIFITLTMNVNWEFFGFTFLAQNKVPNTFYQKILHDTYRL